MFFLALLALFNVAVDTVGAITSDAQLNQLSELETRLINPDPNRDHHESLFKDFLNNEYLKKENIYTIDRIKHDKIVQYLKNEVYYFFLFNHENFWGYTYK